MSQAPWGEGAPTAPQDGVEGPRPSSAPASKPSALGNRTVVIAAAAGVGVLVLAAGGFFLLRGGGEEATTAATTTHSSSAASGSASSSSSSSASSAPSTIAPIPTTVPTVQVAAAGRNPFSSKVAGSGSGSSGSSGTSTSGSTGGGGTASTVTKTVTSNSTTTKTSTTTATKTTTATVPGPTTTVTADPVYLTLLSIGDLEEAAFIVNGTRTDAEPGDEFGPESRFIYQDTVDQDGETCALVTYVEEELTICPGQQLNVS